MAPICCCKRVLPNTAVAYCYLPRPSSASRARRSLLGMELRPQPCACLLSSGELRSLLPSRSERPLRKCSCWALWHARPCTHAPHTEWHALPAGVHELQALAFVIFKVRCGSQASVAMSEAVRQHLELTEATAADCLAAVAALGTELADVQTCSLELPARLLLHTRPPQFASFRRYARWRELTAAPLLLLGEAYGCGAEGLARLKGRLRQLAIEDAADYCAPVYGEFCDATFAVVSSLAGEARRVPGRHSCSCT